MKVGDSQTYPVGAPNASEGKSATDVAHLRTGRRGSIPETC